MEMTLVENFSVPPARVMAAIADIDSWPKWMPNLVRVEKLTEGPFGRGTQWRETRKMFGKEAAEVFEVTAMEDGKSLELRVDGSKGSTGRGEFRFQYQFEAVPTGTRMTILATITGMGCMGVLMGWMFKGMFRKQIAKDHAALRQYLESA